MFKAQLCKLKRFSAILVVMMVFLNTLYEMFLLCQNNLSILIVSILTTVVSGDHLCSVRLTYRLGAITHPLNPLLITQNFNFALTFFQKSEIFSCKFSIFGRKFFIKKLLN